MSQAYTPTLVISECVSLEKIRELPLPGTVLVSVGERVKAKEIVLSAELPGDVAVVRLADALGFEAADIKSAIVAKKGDAVRVGSVLAKMQTFFGLFSSEVTSPVEGIVEYYTETNGHMGIRLAPIPLAINAYIDGFVTEVHPGKSVTIETSASLIQGVFGVGGERYGELYILPVSPEEVVLEETLRSLTEDLRGKILVGGSQFAIDALLYAAKQGVVCVVTGSFDSDTLKNYLGFELRVSVTGDESVPMTVIITEGFGRLPISQRVLELAKSCEGLMASVNGATQVRAGAMRPEVIIPKDPGINCATNAFQTVSLELDSRVRIIRLPHFGEFGTICELPAEPQVIATGAKVRVLKVRLDSGLEIIVPRANVELL